MKVQGFFVAAFLLFSSSAIATTPEDAAAIKQAALDYFEGWYTGSGERMARALSPELAKRLITSGPGGSQILRYSPYIMMVEYAASGAGKKPLETLDIQVKILDTHENIATARITSVDYYDYLHLGKVNGKWKIINVLWTPPQVPDVKGEAVQMEKAIRDYIEGLYTGSRERTVKGLSPELAKRFIANLPNGREFINHTTYLFLVEGAGSGAMKTDLSEVQEVKILGSKGNIASAKLICKSFTDYIHLGKMNGNWKVINVLWKRAN